MAATTAEPAIFSDAEPAPLAAILIVDNQARDRKHPLLLKAIDDCLRSRRAERHPNSAIFVYDIKSPDSEPFLIDFRGFGLRLPVDDRLLCGVD